MSATNGRVYVDAAIWPYGRMVMCHMLADREEDLHAMADRIGVARRWFQNKRYPHYDICKAKRALAVEFGAIEIDRAEFVRRAGSMKIPKSKFHIGDAVRVRCVEAGCAPEFGATVCAINFIPHHQRLEFTVMDAQGHRTDGYTEDWLSPISEPTEISAKDLPEVPELQGCCPVVLYFANDEDRTEFIAAIREAKPGMVARKL